MNSHYVEIKSGLQEGEQVIYAGYDSLHDGDPVVPTEWGQEGTDARGGPLTLPPATGLEAAAPGTVYTCRMHPEVRRNHPGKCPKCGMTLVPVKAGVQAYRRSGTQALGRSAAQAFGPIRPIRPIRPIGTPERPNARTPGLGGAR